MELFSILHSKPFLSYFSHILFYPWIKTHLKEMIGKKKTADMLPVGLLANGISATTQPPRCLPVWHNKKSSAGTDYKFLTVTLAYITSAHKAIFALIKKTLYIIIPPSSSCTPVSPNNFRNYNFFLWYISPPSLKTSFLLRVYYSNFISSHLWIEETTPLSKLHKKQYQCAPSTNIKFINKKAFTFFFSSKNISVYSVQ